ncbi:transposase [Flavobacterium sp. 1]|uniref:transposase n=1 Tax=Flavobacterium sp. 1 TaxID=2035200 RepID=UPI0012FD2C4D|nr:transposase [Flavobacterium sp. 1]
MKRKKWPLEFKICAVTISNQYKSVLIVAQELGISKNCLQLQHWKKLYKDGKLTLQKNSDSDTGQKELLSFKKKNQGDSAGTGYFGKRRRASSAEKTDAVSVHQRKYW